MAQPKLLTNGNAFRRSDNRWGGTVWYADEIGERRRKSFSGTTKQEVTQKMAAYINDFNTKILETQESNKTLRESMQNWLKIFKYPAVERTSYDRYECTARCHIYPTLGSKIVGSIRAAHVKALITQKMADNYSYSTVLKIHQLLYDYFRYLTEQEYILRNPMLGAPMIKKINFFATQDKEYLPTCDTVTIFTPEEIEAFKKEAFKMCVTRENRFYQQAGAYILMLNTGLRVGELAGLLNEDIDLENRVLHVRRSVKEVYHREDGEFHHGRDMKVGKPKSITSNRDVPLNDTAIEMIQDLRREFYFGEDAPLVPDSHGNFTRPSNLRHRYYRILYNAGIERKGMHSFRHTFATNLVNGVKQEDGSIKSLSPRQVADLLGHSTSEVTEMYYVRRDTTRLKGITQGFDL